jgi:hypothetical protein
LRFGRLKEGRFVTGSTVGKRGKIIRGTHLGLRLRRDERLAIDRAALAANQWPSTWAREVLVTTARRMFRGGEPDKSA